MDKLEKDADGRLSRSRYNLWNLIDRYVPTVTQEAVREMTYRYEAQIFDLLATIHEYRERNQQLVERMDRMEKEYYRKVHVPVSLGSFEASAELSPMDFSRRYSIRWSPDQYRASIQIADPIRLDAKETPYLFEMVGRQFEEHVKRELLPKLKTEYLKLYEAFQ